MRKVWQTAALAATALMAGGAAALAQGYGPGNMGGYGAGYGMMRGYGFGYGPVHLIFWAVILIAIVVGIVFMVRSMTNPGGHAMGHGMGHGMGPMPPRRSAGLDVLEERYARGDINRDEYLQKKKDIAG